MTVPSSAPAGFSEVPRQLDAVPDWFVARPESEGFPHYVAVLRSKLWFILLTTAVCVGAAVLYLSLADKVYEAGSDLLITPVPRDNETLIGLGLPHESVDPTRDVETIARLIKNQGVARLVVEQLGLDLSASELLEDVDATPVASSNIVSVTGRANDSEGAARIANAFAAAAVAQRTARMHAQLDLVIPQLRRQIESLNPTDQAREPLLVSLRDLQALRALKDPTIRLETPAEPPRSQVSPRPTLSIAAAILAGLLIGAAGALGLQFLDPRLRREEQLRRFRLPILARIPLESRPSTRKNLPMLPAEVSPATHDSYLLLGATLSVNKVGEGSRRSVLLTGPDSGDGKTTTALNLATVLSMSERVVLVEGDSRRPTLGRSLGRKARHGLSDVLLNRCTLAEALIPLSDSLDSKEASALGVRVLAQSSGEAPLSGIMTSASAASLVRQAYDIGSWLVVDAPPLALVPDALPLAKQVDDIVVVVRLGNTRLKSLEELAELLVQQGITPAGFVLVGVKAHRSYYPGD